MSRLESVLVIDGNGAIVDGCNPTFIPRLPPSVQTKISSEREQIIYWLKRVECSEIEVLELNRRPGAVCFVLFAVFYLEPNRRTKVTSIVLVDNSSIEFALN